MALLTGRMPLDPSSPAGFPLRFRPTSAGQGLVLADPADGSTDCASRLSPLRLAAALFGLRGCFVWASRLLGLGLATALFGLRDCFVWASRLLCLGFAAAWFGPRASARRLGGSAARRLGWLGGRPPARETGVPLGDLARLWALRRASVFDERDPAVVRDFSNLPQPAADLRLCAGPASLADWNRVTERLERLRRSRPEAVLRLELWADGGVPAVPSAAAVMALRAARPLFLHVWIERAAELTAGVRSLLACCVDAGVPVGADIAVRRGNAATLGALRQLCLTLLEFRVRPYVLVDPAWLPDGERLAPAEAETLVRGLRGWISGLAVPQLVEESRAGVRMLRIPEYVLTLDDWGAEVVSYSGSRHRYPNPPRIPPPGK